MSKLIGKRRSYPSRNGFGTKKSKVVQKNMEQRVLAGMRNYVLRIKICTRYISRELEGIYGSEKEDGADNVYAEIRYVDSSERGNIPIYR